MEVAGAERATVRVLDGWAWNEIKALPCNGSGVAFLLNMIEIYGCLASRIAGCMHGHDPSS